MVTKRLTPSATLAGETAGPGTPERSKRYRSAQALIGMRGWLIMVFHQRLHALKGTRPWTQDRRVAHGGSSAGNPTSRSFTGTGNSVAPRQPPPPGYGAAPVVDISDRTLTPR